MDLLIDTHVLIWLFEGSHRLSGPARAALADTTNRLHVSVVTAWEFDDLRRRGRLPALARFEEVLRLLPLTVFGLPADLWRLAERLPNLHGDPTDRMLIAHALHLDIALVTADAIMRSYPIRSLW